MLLIKSDFKPASIKDQLYYTCKMRLVLKVCKEVFSFRSIDLLTFSTTHIIECWNLNVFTLIQSFSLFFSFAFCFFQLFKIFTYILFSSNLLHCCKALLKHIYCQIAIILKHRCVGKVF